jgi:hypothetical protein
VEVIDPTAAGGGLRVELANGRRIVVEARFDASFFGAAEICVPDYRRTESEDRTT